MASSFAAFVYLVSSAAIKHREWCFCRCGDGMLGRALQIEVRENTSRQQIGSDTHVCRGACAHINTDLCRHLETRTGSQTHTFTLLFPHTHTQKHSDHFMSAGGVCQRGEAGDGLSVLRGVWTRLPEPLHTVFAVLIWVRGRVRRGHSSYLPCW